MVSNNMQQTDIKEMSKLQASRDIEERTKKRAVYNFSTLALFTTTKNLGSKHAKEVIPAGYTTTRGIRNGNKRGYPVRYGVLAY